MRLWTYKRPFICEAERYQVCIETATTHVKTTLWRGDQPLGEKVSRFASEADCSNHVIHTPTPSGQSLRVEAGFVSWYNVGIAVDLAGQRIHESHPGKKIEWPKWSRELMENSDLQSPEAKAKTEREAAQWQRNKPSLLIDIALGLLFFVVAKLTDLTTAALVGAVAGLALVLIQRYVKADLLGGLAMFGIFMLLVSAGFSIAFKDEWLIQMKSTILGGFVASLMLTDALANRGQYFGARMGRYIMTPIHWQRFTLGMGGMALALALLNWGVAKALSKELWLYYTTFGDFILAMLLFFAVLRFASVSEGEAAAEGRR